MLYPLQNTYDNWVSIKNETGTTLSNMRVEIGGMQSIGASGAMPALAIQHDLIITLSDQTPTLGGTITNNSNYTISDAVLVTSSGWEILGDLLPNESATVDLSLTNNTSTTSTNQYVIMAQLGMDTYANSTKDTDQQRRASFFKAITASPSNSIHVNSGVYLMGWVDEIPAPAGLKDQPFESIDTMLVFEKLDPGLKTEFGTLMLTSSIYAWESTLGDSITTANYNLSDDGYTLHFQPSLPVNFSKVDSLTLNIESTAASDKIQATLWNFENNTWTLIPLTFNSTNVAEAWQYIGTDGEIKLNMSGDPNDYVEITAVNFTLMVQP